jgi:hypothetical protein
MAEPALLVQHPSLVVRIELWNCLVSTVRSMHWLRYA